jgi:serine/threonine-protein kinase
MPDSQNELDFGRYHIQRLLGRGGMGEVYLARDTALERDVAIKFVSSQKLQDSAARARLLREAQAAAGLDHPCICPVHEAGITEDGRAYIVMPFIDGTPLADIIPRGPMPPREALSLCSQIADALGTAHRHGTCTAI